VAATLLAFRAEGLLAVGDVPGARAAAQEATRIAAPLGDYLRVGAARSTTALIQGLTGDLDGAIALLEPDLQLIDDTAEAPWAPGLARTMGILCLHRGDAAAAVTWFSREAHSTDRSTKTWLAARSLPGLATALITTGTPTEAAAILDAARTTAHHFAMPSPTAETLDAQAALAGDAGKAHELYQRALAERAEYGLWGSVPGSLEWVAVTGARIRPSVEQVRLLGAADAARVSLELPRGAQHNAAVEVCAVLKAGLGADEFADAWVEGQRMTLGEAVALARRSRGQRARPTTGWASLTPTEREVAALVAEGLTNPQIGARLFMSLGTVKTHLGHIFTKLAITNRTELATLAANSPTKPA
jgi:DNA-binding CsgD family transcriptional regulator